MITENLKAPFPYFGGKRLAAPVAWALMGDVKNYVEPFAGSAAMLLNAPTWRGRVETINDFDGFVANFWRAIAKDPDAVAQAVDWPVNENDLFARHSWLVRTQIGALADKLNADPDFYDAKVAGWWCWGLCNWIGSGWCDGKGPLVHDGDKIVKMPPKDRGTGAHLRLPHLGNAGRGINRKLPHLGNAGRGINRKLPHLGNAGRGINRATGTMTRSEFIRGWFADLHARLRDVRVTCGDWGRVVKDSVTVRHGLTGVFLDPPYEKGAMDYGAGGMGMGIAKDVQAWCAENGDNPKLRIVLCGHAGEHDALVSAKGWRAIPWVNGSGYAKTKEAKANYKSETVWASPYCCIGGVEAVEPVYGPLL